MKAITFSLWGDSPVYNIGAIRNADLAAELYPEWKCIYYCFESVPQKTIEALQSRENCIVRFCEGAGNRRSAIERFFPADENGVERIICRDTDSRLSPREAAAVREWEAAGTDFHVMRDHPYHSIPILAGMWGVVGGKLNGIAQASKEFVKSAPEQYKFQDQDFLTKWVWSKVSNGHLTITTHDPIFTGNPFPDGVSRGRDNRGVWFVGQCFDENDVYNSQPDIDVLMKTVSI